MTLGVLANLAALVISHNVLTETATEMDAWATLSMAATSLFCHFAWLIHPTTQEMRQLALKRATEEVQTAEAKARVEKKPADTIV